MNTIQVGDIAQIENSSLKGMVVAVVATPNHLKYHNRYYKTTDVRWWTVLVQVGLRTYQLSPMDFHPFSLQWCNGEILRPATWNVKETE